MARTFTTGNRLVITSPAAWSSEGSVFWRFKPTWNGADSTWHSCWSLFKGGADARCHFEQYSNNNIYAGWYTPGTDSRISLSSSGQFSSGTWANWLLTWDSATPLTTLYKDNSSVGSSNGSLSFVTFTPAALTVGADWENNTGSDGDITEWARWDHALDSTERALLESTGNPACLSTGLLHHYKILGDDSPEPDEVGSEDLTLVGSPAQSAHPTVGSCGSNVDCSVNITGCAGIKVSSTILRSASARLTTQSTVRTAMSRAVAAHAEILARSTVAAKANRLAGASAKLTTRSNVQVSPSLLRGASVRIQSRASMQARASAWRAMAVQLQARSGILCGTIEQLSMAPGRLFDVPYEQRVFRVRYEDRTFRVPRA